MKVPPPSYARHQAGRAGRLHLGDHDARGCETYSVGGETEGRNIDLVHRLREIVTEETGGPASVYTALIRFRGLVADRPGHDQRYAIDCSKLKRGLGWSQAHGFDEGLRHTVRRFLVDPRAVDVWSKEFFRDLAGRIRTE